MVNPKNLRNLLFFTVDCKLLFMRFPKICALVKPFDAMKHFLFRIIFGRKHTHAARVCGSFLGFQLEEFTGKETHAFHHMHLDFYFMLFLEFTHISRW